MFRQYAIARFIIGFIMFVLTYMVATLSYDYFFHFLTAGMFALHLYIMSEVHHGQQEALAKKDLECDQKRTEMQELLDRKEQECQQLIRLIRKAQSDE